MYKILYYLIWKKKITNIYKKKKWNNLYPFKVEKTNSKNNIFVHGDKCQPTLKVKYNKCKNHQKYFYKKFVL